MFKLENIEYTYSDSSQTVSIDSFAGAQASKCVVLGDSGSGKSTLIKVMSGLLTPKNGSVNICGKDIFQLSEPERDLFRGQNIGIIFQGNHLLKTLTIEENLSLANFAINEKVDRTQVLNILRELEISELADRYPETLSQGQKQRAAIGRSLVNDPSIILADEPTSSLDDSNAERVLELLFKEAERLQATLVIATHDQRVKSKIKTVFQLT